MSKNIYSYVFKVFFQCIPSSCTFCCLVYVAYTIHITGIITHIQSKTNTEIIKEIYIYMNILIYIFIIKLKHNRKFFCEYNR